MNLIFEIYNYAPKFNYQIDNMQIEVGIEFKWKIPRDLAFDEDGDSFSF